MEKDEFGEIVDRLLNLLNSTNYRYVDEVQDDIKRLAKIYYGVVKKSEETKNDRKEALAAWLAIWERDRLS